MKQNLLTDAITELDDDLIEAADKQKRPLSKQSAIRWCIIAAAALFATTVTVYAVDTVISSPPSPPSPHTTTAPITEPMPILPAGMQEMTYTPTWYYASPADAFWGETTEGTPLRLSALVPEGWEVRDGTAHLSSETDDDAWSVSFGTVLYAAGAPDISEDPEFGTALRVGAEYDHTAVISGTTQHWMRYAYYRLDPAEGSDRYGACGVLEIAPNWYVSFTVTAPLGCEAEIFNILATVDLPKIMAGAPADTVPEGMQLFAWKPVKYFTPGDQSLHSDGSIVSVCTRVPESWRIEENEACYYGRHADEDRGIRFFDVLRADDVSDFETDPGFGVFRLTTTFYDTSRFLRGETESGMRYAYHEINSEETHQYYMIWGILELPGGWYVNFEAWAPWENEKDVIDLLDTVYGTEAEIRITPSPKPPEPLPDEKDCLVFHADLDRDRIDDKILLFVTDEGASVRFVSGATGRELPGAVPALDDAHRGAYFLTTDTSLHTESFLYWRYSYANNGLFLVTESFGITFSEDGTRATTSESSTKRWDLRPDRIGDSASPFCVEVTLFSNCAYAGSDVRGTLLYSNLGDDVRYSLPDNPILLTKEDALISKTVEDYVVPTPAGMQTMYYIPTSFAASVDDAFWGIFTDGSPAAISALVPEGWEIGEGTASLVKDPYTERWDVYFTALIAGKPYFDIARDPELGGALRITSWYDTSKILTGETKSGMRYAYCRGKAVTADGDDISLSGACGVLELREDLHIGFELVAPWGSEEDVFAILDSVEYESLPTVILP